LFGTDFRESIAIDERIKAISKKALGISFRNYEDEEDFYREAAHGAELEGWELDRLMYQFTNEFLEELCPAEVDVSRT